VLKTVEICLSVTVSVEIISLTQERFLRLSSQSFNWGTDNYQINTKTQTMAKENLTKNPDLVVKRLIWHVARKEIRSMLTENWCSQSMIVLPSRKCIHKPRTVLYIMSCIHFYKQMLNDSLAVNKYAWVISLAAAADSKPVTSIAFVCLFVCTKYF